MTMITPLCEYLGYTLLHWLSKESILENMSKVFRKAGYLKTRIIDCTEVRIEQLKKTKS